tara:strand:- start:133 stop:450 length:318 start_codon:yes stop_codon:yes gene_type:complete
MVPRFGRSTHFYRLGLLWWVVSGLQKHFSICWSLAAARVVSSMAAAAVQVVCDNLLGCHCPPVHTEWLSGRVGIEVPSPPAAQTARLILKQISAAVELADMAAQA